MEQNTNTKSGSCCGSVKDQIKAKWDKLTEQDVNDAEKHMEALSGKIQKAYGRSKDVVDREVTEFRKTLSPDKDHPKHV